MFHSSTPSYPEMSPAPGNTTSFHQTPNSAANTPVYVPSNRAISHAQYGHAGNYTNAQNGWPAESAFGKLYSFKFLIHILLKTLMCCLLLSKTGSTHSPFYAQNMMYMRAYDPSGFQRTSPYGMGKVLFLIYWLNWASLIDFFFLSHFYI